MELAGFYVGRMTSAAPTNFLAHVVKLIVVAIRRIDHGAPPDEWRLISSGDGGYQMRRLDKDGQWQYRPATEEEGLQAMFF